MKEEEEAECGVSSEKPNISKLSRKVGEKIRRDKLNNLITQLAEEIPTIKYAQRRPDKLAILRLTVSYLKLHHGLKKRKVVNQCLKSFGCLYGAAKKATDGVIFITTKSGSILYVSENIRNFLGFHQMDVIGFNIEKFIHEADFKTFTSLFSHESITLASFQGESPCLSPRDIHNVEVHNINKNSFYLHMLHASKKRPEVEPTESRYELMHCSSFVDYACHQTESEPWLVAFMTPFRRETINEIEVTNSDFTNCNEFATLHDLDGTILASDQRASLFHGFLVTEIVGKSPYLFVLDEDLQSIALSHQLILKKDEIPVTAYRMKNRLDLSLYIQSKSVIISDKWTKQPKCIVSVNTVFSEEDGKKMLEEQKRKLAELQKAAEGLTLSDSTSEKSPEKSINITDSPPITPVTLDWLDQASASSALTIDRSPTLLDDSSSSSQSLGEIYVKQAEKYPDLYSKPPLLDDGKSNTNFSVKRRCEELDGGDVNESDQFTNFGNYASQEGELTAVGTAKNKIKLKDHSSPNNTSMSEKSSSKITDMSKESSSFTSSSHQHSQPILKGILEGQLTLSDIVYSVQGQGNAMGPRRNTEGEINSHMSRSSAASGVDCQIGEEMNNCVGASNGFTVQSPTVGTSDHDVGFRSKFAHQLQLKHTQLKETLYTQKSTLQFLRNQLQIDPELSHLDQKDSAVHKNLIGKIMEAENQVDIQSSLLSEIEEEFQGQSDSSSRLV